MWRNTSMKQAPDQYMMQLATAQCWREVTRRTNTNIDGTKQTTMWGNSNTKQLPNQHVMQLVGAK